MINFQAQFRLYVFFLTAIALIALTANGCQPQKQADPQEKITIAYTTSLNGVLVHIAFSNGYFTEEGLNATPQPHAVGKLALDAVIAGKADLATAADTPIMFAIMGGKKITILAVIQTGNRNEAIVARQDRRIMKPSDLKGKKIGLALHSKSHFFTEAFLVAHGINRKQVKIINLNPDEIVDALGTGRVDAVSTWNPILAQLIKRLGNNGRVFYGENFYAENFCVATGQEYPKNNPEAIKKFLRALLKAEIFVQQHPEESKRLAAKFTKADKAILDETWDIFNFRVSLDQVLLVNLEDETRRAMKNRLVARRDMPNYLDFIYVEGLQAVKPEAVRIIR